VRSPNGQAGRSGTTARTESDDLCQATGVTSTVAGRAADAVAENRRYVDGACYRGASLTDPAVPWYLPLASRSLATVTAAAFGAWRRR
jgi:hypothetical protein